MTILTVDDLKVFAPDLDFAQAEAMITDAMAQAQLVAPCLGDPARLTPLQRDQFRAVLRGAVLRWHETGLGAITTTLDVAGSFTHQETIDGTANRSRRGVFWPSELDLLESICRGRGRRAGTVDTTPDLPLGWPS
ncbi:MAG: hypothetical protein LBK54_10330 [Propionibacteriaceae bacterium]|jgi:hypothetical protein|nr:hypothetical protein [Propionibacteriaceae bacterium]